ncbi:hypothetical protein Tco_0993231 [Tanacetum coccineum]|uniref:Retrotransposon gag domain-containing protein n=1 Tax=Tanacetum coccineum TaxID=301880 RepID=A0ABQ5F6I4_9ASTR
MADDEMKPTMKEFASNDQENYYSGITSIKVNGKTTYELKGKFLDDLHNNAFSGTNGEDADKLRVLIFPISLVGDAWKWFDEIKGSINSWVDLTAKFFKKYYSPSRTDRINSPITKWDPANRKFENGLTSKFVNYKTMDIFTKGALWDYWKTRSDETEPTNEKFPNLKKEYWNDEDETAEIFKIETYIFDYESPLCMAFNEFNYLLKVDLELFTYDIKRTENYDDYMNKFNDEFENLGMKMVNFLDEMKHEEEERCEVFDDHERPVCYIRRFEMIKYSFRDDKEYVAIKENEYDDLTNTSKEAIHAYQEIFRMMDEGWMVTRME